MQLQSTPSGPSFLAISRARGRFKLAEGLTTVDEAAIFAEVRETVPAFLTEHAELERLNNMFDPYFAEIHRRASQEDVGLNRYAGGAPAWRASNWR